jgi:hypothetical protein
VLRSPLVTYTIPVGSSVARARRIPSRFPVRLARRSLQFSWVREKGFPIKTFIVMCLSHFFMPGHTLFPTLLDYGGMERSAQTILLDAGWRDPTRRFRRNPRRGGKGAETTVDPSRHYFWFPEVFRRGAESALLMPLMPLFSAVIAPFLMMYAI